MSEGGDLEESVQDGAMSRGFMRLDSDASAAKDGWLWE